MAKPYATNGVLIGQGAAVDPKTTAAGAADTVFRVPTAGGEPAFGTVSLTAGVTGVLPVANGGTNQAAGAVAFLTFYGVAVAASTVFLGRVDDVTELVVQYRCPAAGVVTTMYSQASVAAGVGQTFTYTLRVEAADTSMTFAVTGTGGGGRTGSATGTITVAAGDRVAVKLVVSAGAAAANHVVTLAIRVTA
jgi:hypothetical protein